ncbi:MAG: hypothetical protein KBC33_02540 [Candidatus Pacebacteria bacterium]|nr:hypothetical protein [Candidatus Paceibacterota bacterium]
MESLKPMSRRSRFALALAAFFAFLVMVPALILYASGYRFSSVQGESGLVPMGALSVAVPDRPATLFVDGQAVAEPGLFADSFFLRNIHPGVHTLDVVASGTMPWHREVYVMPTKVAYAFPFILPTEPKIQQLTNASSSYAVVVKTFASSSPVNLATSSDSAHVRSNVAVWIEDGHTVLVEWRGSDSETPYFLCSVVDAQELCLEQTFIVIKSMVLSVDFFPGRDDVLVLTTDQGVFALEVDNRTERTLLPLHVAKNAQALVSNGRIYVKDAKGIFELSI